MAIREKLAQMRDLFADEEDRDEKNGDHGGQKGLPRPESSEWDLHNHKLLYEETMQKREKRIEIEEARKKS